jgi:3-methyladenine DNA glycosylase/8-oxoguanine DNA glycosylase
VEAWGDGAPWALDAAPTALGVLDDRAGFAPSHPVVADLHRHADGLRLPRTQRVVEALVPAILSQRVTGFEARRSFRQLVERWGEPAPGPGGLRVPPAPDVVAELGYYDLHVVGVEKKRADTLKRACAHATRLEAAGALPSATLRERLEAVPGIGPWTSAEVARLARGDADAVSVGDFHLKNLVAHTLAGEPRGTDERMLELLEPFAGHRGRVCLLIETAGLTAPRYGPRQRIEPIAGR